MAKKESKNLFKLILPFAVLVFGVLAIVMMAMNFVGINTVTTETNTILGAQVTTTNGLLVAINGFAAAFGGEGILEWYVVVEEPILSVAMDVNGNVVIMVAFILVVVGALLPIITVVLKNKMANKLIYLLSALALIAGAIIFFFSATIVKDAIAQEITDASNGLFELNLDETPLTLGIGAIISGIAAILGALSAGTGVVKA